jgi:nucleoid-associated protein YejK
MSLPEFQESLRILGKDSKLLRDNLARQLYAMGGSLTTKYRYLQIAYLVFLATLVVATLAFAGVFLALRP